jgi:hypothetical protein
MATSACQRTAGGHEASEALSLYCFGEEMRCTDAAQYDLNINTSWGPLEPKRRLHPCRCTACYKTMQETQTVSL